MICKGPNCQRDFDYILMHLSQAPQCKAAYSTSEYVELESLAKNKRRARRRMKYDADYINAVSYIKEMSRPVVKGDKGILSLSCSMEIYVTRYHVRNRSQPSRIVHNQTEGKIKDIKI